MKKFLVMSIVLLTAGTIAAAALSGKDYVEKGKPGKVSGVLLEESAEWYVIDGVNKIAIHMGPVFYRDEIKLNLKENDKVTAEGFVYENELTVTKLIYNGKEYNFRDSNGDPLWAGRGNRQGNGLRSRN